MPPSDPCELIVRGLRAELDGRQVLSDIGFVARPGTVTAIVGPNGAGKSTILRAIAGLIQVKAGSVDFGGHDVLRCRRRHRAQFLALVEQRAVQDITARVQSIVELGRLPHQSRWAMETARHSVFVSAAIEALHLQALTDRSYTTLSGGEQQRVQIARALAQDPSVLLLDEPANHLDIRAQHDVLRIMRSQAQKQRVVVTTLHDLNHAVAVADQVVVVSDGRVWAAGPADEVITPSMLRMVYGVDNAVVKHPRTGRPVVTIEI